jgi:hypothetical protein
VHTEVILVGVLVGTTLYAYGLDFLTYRRIGLIEYTTIFEVFEFGTDESGAFAGLNVLEVDNEESLVVHIDAHTDFDV